jgi:hypothetical protein
MLTTSHEHHFILSHVLMITGIDGVGMVNRFIDHLQVVTTNNYNTMVNRFIDHLQVVTTNNYNTIAGFHTTNHSTLSLLSLHSLVFTW